MVSSKLLRLFLDDAWDATDSSTLTLRQQLRAWESDVREIIAGGSIGSTSANGRHVSYASSQEGNITQLDIAEAWRRLIDVHDQSVLDLGAPSDGSEDQAVYDRMMTHLREILGYTNNWMYVSK